MLDVVLYQQSFWVLLSNAFLKWKEYSYPQFLRQKTEKLKNLKECLKMKNYQLQIEHLVRYHGNMMSKSVRLPALAL